MQLDTTQGSGKGEDGSAMPDANPKGSQGQFHHSPLPRPQFGAADRRAAFRASVVLVEGGDCIPNAARTEDVRAEGIIEVHTSATAAFGKEDRLSPQLNGASELKSPTLRQRRRAPTPPLRRCPESYSLTRTAKLWRQSESLRRDGPRNVRLRGECALG